MSDEPIIVRCATTSGGHAVWINVNQVQTMTDIPNGTEITFASGDVEHVRETAEEIESLVRAVIYARRGIRSKPVGTQ